MKLEDRMLQLIAQQNGVVLLRSDFKALGASQSQVNRVLRKMISQGTIQRVSQGAFVKTKINKFTGLPTPAATLEVVARELFAKLNIVVGPAPAVLEYNAGLTTQFPPGGVVQVKGRRITRKIEVAGRILRFV